LTPSPTHDITTRVESEEGKTRAKESKVSKPQDKRATTSPQNGAKGGRPPHPPYAVIATDFVTEHYMPPDKAEELEGDGGLAFPASAMDETGPALRHWRGGWLSYNGKGWQPRNEEDISKKLVDWMEDKFEWGLGVGGEFVRNILLHAKSFGLCGVDGIVNMPVWLSSGKTAKNWMGFHNKKAVNIWDYAENLPKQRKGVVVDTSPDLFSRDYVIYDFEPTAKCPLFHKYLERVLPSKASRTQVQEMVGLLLADTTDYELFFYLYGPTARNGKTVLLEIISALVGKHNVSHVGLGAITDRFESWPLAEAKVNICGDMATDTGKAGLAHVEGLFKDLISGSDIEYQKKNRDKFDVPCRARFVFAGNSLPTFVDRSDAIWERLRVVHFPVQIPLSERDPNLAEKIIGSELPGIFQWAMSGLHRVIEQKGIPDTEESQKIKSEHRVECDHEKKFIVDCGYVRGEEKDYVPMAQILESYKRWMTDNGYIPKGSGRFYQRIESLIPGVVRKQKKLPGLTSPVWAFFNLKVN